MKEERKEGRKKGRKEGRKYLKGAVGLEVLHKVFVHCIARELDGQ
jgi:hypothetical protein